MLKKILNLNGTKQLKKEKQSVINGGRISLGPCGGTGGMIYHSDPNCHCPGIWSGGNCWVCY
ncbi:hypothetical protein [Kordia aestuariivivens]|uniref:hypothetical protein n=1 Tax=Kordia aestuariivivens TaxID=2759037 RepID=UPI001C07A652|nr:hypothetical protein [Kordia aestuariivivens]